MKMREHIGELLGGTVGAIHGLLMVSFTDALVTAISTVSLALIGGVAGAAGQYLFKKYIEK